MSEPMTDERVTEIMEMAAEAEHAPRLKAEVDRLRKQNTQLKEEIKQLNHWIGSRM